MGVTAVGLMVIELIPVVVTVMEGIVAVEASKTDRRLNKEARVEVRNEGEGTVAGRKERVDGSMGGSMGGWVKEEPDRFLCVLFSLVPGDLGKRKGGTL